MRLRKGDDRVGNAILFGIHQRSSHGHVIVQRDRRSFRFSALQRNLLLDILIALFHDAHRIIAIQQRRALIMPRRLRVQANARLAGLLMRQQNRIRLNRLANNIRQFQRQKIHGNDERADIDFLRRVRHHGGDVFAVALIIRIIPDDGKLLLSF